MRKQIIIVCAVFLTAFKIQAQDNHKHKHNDTKEIATVQPFEYINDSLKSKVGNLLTDYYALKDALITSDDATASKKAKAFRKTLELVDMKSMTPAQHSFYMPLQKKLDYDAEHIQGSPNIDHMREHFASFSANMFSLVKAFKGSNTTTVYYDYCPMQKANWISSEEAIKNPYYGKQMLTCGKITETIK